MSRTWNHLPYRIWIEHPKTMVTKEYWQTTKYECDCQGDRYCTWRHTVTGELHTEVFNRPIKNHGCQCCRNDNQFTNRRERRAVKAALQNWDDDEFSGRYVKPDWW